MMELRWTVLRERVNGRRLTSYGIAQACADLISLRPQIHPVLLNRKHFDM